jgi:hypothetical protein
VSAGRMLNAHSPAFVTLLQVSVLRPQLPTPTPTPTPTTVERISTPPYLGVGVGWGSRTYDHSEWQGSRVGISTSKQSQGSSKIGS